MAKKYLVKTKSNTEHEELSSGYYVVYAKNKSCVPKHMERYWKHLGNKLNETITSVERFYKENPGYNVELMQLPILLIKEDADENIN